MSRFAVEAALHWGGVAFYIAAAALLGGAVFFGRTRAARWGAAAILAGLLVHGAGIVVRWVGEGHGPYIARFEVLSSNAWIALAMAGFVVWRRPAWSAIGLVVLPIAILAIGLGLFSAPQATELPPTLRSVWLVFHITFAKLAAGAFLLSLASSVLLLLARRPRPGTWRDRIPPTEVLDAWTVRLVGFGFVFWTTAVAAGAIWANQSWGRYWGWDPIETWSLVAWLVYGSWLHARIFFRLRPVASAWLSVGAFAVFILTLLILPAVMPSIHSAYFQ